MHHNDDDSIEIDLTHSGNPFPKVRARGVVAAVILSSVLGVACNVAVVSLFLQHLESTTSHTDHIDNLRIQQCHEISDRGAEAMEKMADAMASQSLAFGQFSVRLAELESEIKEQNDIFRRTFEPRGL